MTGTQLPARAGAPPFRGPTFRLPTLTTVMRPAEALWCKVSELAKPLDGYEG